MSKEITFPGLGDAAAPFYPGYKGAFSVFQNIPLIMPLFSAQPVIPVLYHDL